MQLLHLLHVAFRLLFQLADQIFYFLLILINLKFEGGLLLRNFFYFRRIAQDKRLFVIEFLSQGISLSFGSLLGVFNL